MFEALRERLGSFIGSVKDKTEPKLSAVTQVKAAVTGRATLTEADVSDTLWQLETGLLQSDVSMETAEHIVGSLKGRLVGLEVSSGSAGEAVRAKLREALLEALKPGKEVDLVGSARAGKKPYKVLVLGVNGTGKTTSMAKIAKLLMDNGMSVVFAAGDTFRAGAIEQLEEHARRLGVRVVSHQRGGDSAAVLYDAVEHAAAWGVDVVLADTAGRMQSKANLMEELKKVVRVYKPDMTLFVADALAGNDTVEQARTFNEAVGFDAAVLSKMDADAKGGSALSIVHATGKPVIYIGVGQGYADLKRFDGNWFVDKILS